MQHGSQASGMLFWVLVYIHTHMKELRKCRHVSNSHQNTSLENIVVYRFRTYLRMILNYLKAILQLFTYKTIYKN